MSRSGRLSLVCALSLVGVAPLILTVTNNLPVKNAGELIAYAKANPGKISFGSSGVGAAAHLTSELLKQVAGIQMEHVPYKGTAPALADLVSGNIQMLVDAPIGVMAHVRSGKIRGLCMFSKERVPGAEEVPTIVESGGPLIESSSWSMFLAPAGTPTDVVAKLNAATNAALQMPEATAALREDEEREGHRIAYVACTRAEDRLIIAGARGDSVESGSVLAWTTTSSDSENTLRTTRSVTFSPAMSAAFTSASSASRRVPDSATRAPTPCTVCSRRNHSRSSADAKPYSFMASSLTFISIIRLAGAPTARRDRVEAGHCTR